LKEINLGIPIGQVDHLIILGFLNLKIQTLSIKPNSGSRI